MKQKLIKTVKQIEALRPGAARREIPDAAVRGLRLCVFPTGKMSWVYRYRFGGRTRKLTIEAGGTDLSLARKLASGAMNAVASGRDPGVEKQERKQAESALTIAGLIDLYAAERLAKLRSGDEVERVLRKEMKPYMGRLADGGVSEFEAVDLIRSVKRRGAVVANRSLSYCKTLFNFALDPEVRAATVNPFAHLKLTDEDGRERVLSKIEIKAVWTAAESLGHPYTAIVRLLLLTAQRLHEIADLRWSEVDLDERKITLPGSRTKNGESHVVALSDAAVAILKAAPKIKNDDDLVFTLTGHPLNGWTKMRHRLYDAVKATERWTIHDLRRTVATGMAEDLKIAPHVIDKVLNHTTGIVKGVAAVYNRAALLDERRAALEAWGRYVTDLVNGGASKNVVQLRA